MPINSLGGGRERGVGIMLNEPNHMNNSKEIKLWERRTKGRERAFSSRRVRER
jgi:hypothetical protein